MDTTLKGLTPGATYNAHLATKASAFVDQLQQTPGTALASGNASSVGELTLDLPVGQEVLVQGPTGDARRVLNSTTRPSAPNP